MLVVNESGNGGIFGRASESMLGNFVIYCGLVLVYYSCYVALEFSHAIFRNGLFTLRDI